MTTIHDQYCQYHKIIVYDTSSKRKINIIICFLKNRNYISDSRKTLFKQRNPTKQKTNQKTYKYDLKPYISDLILSPRLVVIHQAHQLNLLQFLLIWPARPVRTSTAPIFTIDLTNWRLKKALLDAYRATIPRVNGSVASRWSTCNTPLLLRICLKKSLSNLNGVDWSSAADALFAQVFLSLHYKKKTKFRILFLWVKIRNFFIECAQVFMDQIYFLTILERKKGLEKSKLHKDEIQLLAIFNELKNLVVFFK